VTSLATFGGDDLARLGDAIREIPKGHSVMESSARAVVDLLWEELGHDCALIRLYKTHRYGRLPDDLQRFAGGLSRGVPGPDVRCLTLLATRGREEQWNDRRASEGHKSIPLQNVELVERLPMVAGLVRQLGLELEDVVEPERGRVTELAQRTYGVFHVEDAAGSPYVPAQDFVRRYGIRSALGFGGVLYTGDFYAVVLFSRVHVSQPVAETVRVLSLATRVALLPFGLRVFES
jgi:hypothetical protein